MRLRSKGVPITTTCIFSRRRHDGRALKYRVTIDPAALADLRSIRAYDRSAILDTVERVLGTTPTQVGKSRIKRLRGLDSPQYRLRVGEFRVFYDVSGEEVYVMRVLAKSAVAEYLREMGYEIEDGKRRTTGPGNGEGG
jgi:mRNA-degrading endonuclease RelE of RelBE toxin-antitoxin system